MIRGMKKKDQEKKTSFVRLTKLDGDPIWLNASFVVTVEPRRGGGSTVVPIGDGLDYDVRERPEDVLAYLDGAPVPEVVPVPASDALTLTPDDVSPEGACDDAKKKPESAKPARNPPCKSEAPAFVPGPGAPAAGELLEGEVARLRKMAPRTVKKLQNTIKTQFRAANLEVAISALVSKGIIAIDGTRINWHPPVSMEKIEVSASEEVAPPPQEEPPQEEVPPPQVEEPPPSEQQPEPEAAQDAKPAKVKKAKKPAAKARKAVKKK